MTMIESTTSRMLKCDTPLSQDTQRQNTIPHKQESLNPSIRRPSVWDDWTKFIHDPNAPKWAPRDFGKREGYYRHEGD
jgi:sensor domain CHASE-containing protein